MADTLHLSSGEIEVIFDEKDKARILGDIIRERLGRDCEELFYHIITEQTCSDDYEKIADEYRTMLINAMEELDAALLLFRGKRLNKANLEKILQNCRNDIYNNL